MNVQIIYNNSSFKNDLENKLFFVDENQKIQSLKKFMDIKEYSYVSDLFKNTDNNKKISFFQISSTKNIVLIKLKKNIKNYEIENLGGDFFNFIKGSEKKNFVINSDSISYNINNLVGYFLHGVKLKSYKFEKYLTKKEKKIIKITVTGTNKPSLKDQIRFKAIEEGTYYARDLVSEPGNVLHPDEYAKRINLLKKNKLKINIYDEKKLKKLGMNTLLGVGQGSIRGSYLVTIEWKGRKDNSKPLAFVGKGVCFDTGGISLKPARFMEEMKYDMAGAGTVTGLMKTLALRKAKVNAVGVVGLVENMPDGNAQRPGDVVKSYSGQTIEIFNTDAEGRLVLADILTYTEKRFKPKFMINLATLTGAIIVSLGNEFAGLFSNNDQLADRINKAGYKDNEKSWRLPLDKNFDKLMDSKIADMQNINYSGGAGSITAAQFLQRFIMNKTPWAHLDIAGMAWTKKTTKTIPYGATGYGVKLLNRLVEEYYE